MANSEPDETATAIMTQLRSVGESLLRAQALILTVEKDFNKENRTGVEALYMARTDIQNSTSELYLLLYEYAYVLRDELKGQCFGNWFSEQIKLTKNKGGFSGQTNQENKH